MPWNAFLGLAWMSGAMAVIKRIERTVRRHDSGNYQHKICLLLCTCQVGMGITEMKATTTRTFLMNRLHISVWTTHGTRWNIVRILYDPRIILLLIKRNARDVHENLTYIITLLMSSQIVSYACTVLRTPCCTEYVDCMYASTIHVHSNNARCVGP